MNSARRWALGFAFIGAAGCYSGDGPDTGGACADCVLESGDYEYSGWSLVSDECAFDMTDPEGDWTWVDVFGDDFLIDDFIEGTLTNGIAEGAVDVSIDLWDNGYDCVLDYELTLRGRVPEDWILDVTSQTFRYVDGGGSDCDEAWSDFGFTSTLPCGGEVRYTLSYIE